MKAAYLDLRRRGAPLVVGEIPEPGISGDQLKIAVYAASVNPVDWKTIRSVRRLLPATGVPLPPWIVGNDASGVVLEVGPRVTKFAPGDEVFLFRRALGLATAEVIRERESVVARKPAGMSHAEAAALPLAGVTAWQALVTRAEVAGKRALVIGGSGGVGHYAVQIAKARGAHVTAVCSTRNVEWVASLGADEVIDYTKERFHDRLSGLDVVYDTIGTDSLSTCRGVLRPGGRFVSTAPRVRARIEMLMSLPNRLPGVPGRRAYGFTAWPNGRDLRALADLVDAGRLRSHIHAEYPMSEIELAHAESQRGRARGKIVIRVRSEAG